MPSDVALLTETPAPWDFPALGIASLAAFLAASPKKKGAPDPHFTLHLLLTGQQDVLELELFRRRPTWLVVWLPPASTTGLGRTLSRLRPLLPATRIVLVGPLLTDQIDAERLLTHIPEADLALWGEPEAGLLELTGLSARSGIRSWLGVAGVSARSGNRIAHGPKARAPLDPTRLPSPYLAGDLPPPGKNSGRADLELQRSAIPFSPLSPALHASPPRPIPLDRLREELTRLFDAGVPLVRLVGGNADLAPAQLRAFLEMAAERNSRTALQLELASVPAPELGALLGRAGVARIDLRDPAGGPRDEGGGLLLDRNGLRHLTEQGIQVSIQVPIGRPGDTRENIRRRIDYYLSLPDVKVGLEPLRLWPGHPLRGPGEASQANPEPEQGNSALRVAGPPGFEVLETAELTFEDGLAFRQWIPLLESLHARHEASLRLLARALEVTPVNLLERLVQGLEAGSRDADPSRQLTTFMRAALREAGKLDRLPVLEALLELERWRDAPPRLVPPFWSREYDVDDMDEVVLARAPGLEMRTFPYNLLELLWNGRVEDAPLRRTHIALRRQGYRRPLMSTVNDLQLGLFELVDGRRTVREIIGGSSLRPENAVVGNAALQPPVNAPSSTPGSTPGNPTASLTGNHTGHEDELRHGLISLLSQGYVYVRRHRAVPPIDLFKPGKGRILSFRTARPRREARPPDEEM